MGALAVAFQMSFVGVGMNAAMVMPIAAKYVAMT
jgi:maltodextrin utilization protein YvdJ